jgi:muramoyltetrapeptide carboxypeptidase
MDDIAIQPGEPMTQNRRTFLKAAALAALASRLGPGLRAAEAPRGVLKPRRLAAGATVGLVSPAGVVWTADELAIVQESLAAMGLRTKVGAHALDRYGYLAGRDADRASDVNAMFADDAVDAILCARGGWGCNRILPLLDYAAIARHPKILVGYSDITSLLNAVHARTGLVTFHGPVGASAWNAFSLDFFRRVLFQGEAVVMENPHVKGDNLTVVQDRIQTITPGRAQGRLLGGNLTVLSAMLGSAYLPDWTGCILFLEDTNEDIYRIDRMLTQLSLAGVLGRAAGVVFGKCTKCGPGESHGSLTLEEVQADHLKPLKVPAFTGSMIGHIDNKFTVPVGARAEIDAGRGTITLLEPAVR